MPTDGTPIQAFAYPASPAADSSSNSTMEPSSTRRATSASSSARSSAFFLFRFRPSNFHRQLSSVQFVSTSTASGSSANSSMASRRSNDMSSAASSTIDMARLTLAAPFLRTVLSTLAGSTPSSSILWAPRDLSSSVSFSLSSVASIAMTTSASSSESHTFAVNVSALRFTSAR